MKIITIAGNVTRDAELRTTQNGDKVAGFGVAVNGRRRDDPATFFDCSIWGKRGEALSQYLTKGAKVTINGDFSTREHNGKTYLQVNANEVALQGGRNDGQRDSGAQQGSGRPSAPASDMDDEIPWSPEWRA